MSDQSLIFHDLSKMPSVCKNCWRYLKSIQIRNKPTKSWLCKNPRCKIHISIMTKKIEKQKIEKLKDGGKVELY